MAHAFFEPGHKLHGGTINDDVRETFHRMWREGYDGKDLAKAFVRIAAEVVKQEHPDDLAELRDQI